MPLAFPAPHHYDPNQMLVNFPLWLWLSFRAWSASVSSGDWPPTVELVRFFRLIPRGADTYHDFRPACAVGVMRAVSTPRLRGDIQTLTDLDKLTRTQEQLDAAAKQRADEKSVFGVNFQNVCESVDALQRAIVVVSARSDAVGMALLQRQSKTEADMHRVMVALLKEQRWRKMVD